MPNSLGRRPEATVFSIEDLVKRVQRGEVRIPKFQRRLNWKARDIRLFFDSIYRGYPIGSLLFWKRSAPADSVRLGPIIVDAPASKDAWWVIDGQQRITSLVGALLHPDPVNEKGEYALGIDLATEEIVGSRASLPKSWMPLNLVFNTTQLLAWLRAYDPLGLLQEHRAVAFGIVNAIREYQIPAYIIESDDESTAYEVFRRLDAAPHKLEPDEVFEALANSDDTPGSATLRAISESVESLGFGRFDHTWIQKSILAIAGVDLTRPMAMRALRDTGKEAHVAAERALRDTAIFLRRDAALHHLSLLPYSLPIVILAKFFSRHASPRPRTRDLLARWLWRGAVTGEHRGEVVPRLRAMLAAVDQLEEEAVQALLRLHARPQSTASFTALAAFNWKNARTKIEASALLDLGPRDLITGRPLPIADVLQDDGSVAFKHFFHVKGRTSDLAPAKKPPSLHNSIANRFLYHQDADPANLLAKALRHPEAQSMLLSHALDAREAARILEPGAARREAEASFLEARAALLRRQLERFVGLRARWHETDRPSLASLTIPDTEDSNAQAGP